MSQTPPESAGSPEQPDVPQEPVTGPLPDPVTRPQPAASPPAQSPAEGAAATPGNPPPPLPGPDGTRLPAGGPPVTTVTRRRRMLEMATIALVAALLGSGCTQLALNSDQPPSNSRSALVGSEQPPGPVVQANPVAPDWSATAAAVSPSVVAISIGAGSRTVGEGSGVIIDQQGHIITNHHVVNAGGRGGGTLTVTLNDRRTYDAKVTGTDPATDLAVITLTTVPADLRPIAMGDSQRLRVGDPVMAVGNPLGLAGTVTTGIVSALNRPVTTQGESSDPFGQGGSEPVVTNAVQTSAAINPGNSGGALVDASGRLVGINSSIASTGTSGGNIGIGFAIPVNEARSVADQLIKSGTVKHAYLGVVLDDGFVQDGDAKRPAAIISDVRSGTPGAQAGLQRGDGVVAIDGDAVDSHLALVGQIRQRNVGDRATLTVIRDGSRQEIGVTLGERPSSGG